MGIYGRNSSIRDGNMVLHGCTRGFHGGNSGVNVVTCVCMLTLIWMVLSVGVGTIREICNRGYRICNRRIQRLQGKHQKDLCCHYKYPVNTRQAHVTTLREHS